MPLHRLQRCASTPRIAQSEDCSTPSMQSCHASHLFRSCRSSRLQRFTPRIALQVYCTLQPIMGFAMFQNPSSARRCPQQSGPKTHLVSYRKARCSRKSPVFTVTVTWYPKTPLTGQPCPLQTFRRTSFNTISASDPTFPERMWCPALRLTRLAIHSLWRSTLQSFPLNTSCTLSPQFPEFTKSHFLLAVILPAISPFYPSEKGVKRLDQRPISGLKALFQC